MPKDIESARDNRDVTAALLNSGLPNDVEEPILAALEAAGVRDPVDTLLGECQRSAVALRDELRDHDFDAMAVHGWVVDMEKGIVPRDMSEAESLGVVHWWVEAQVRGEWVTFDLATTLGGERWGDLYVGPRPAEYRPHEIDPQALMDEIRETYDLEPPRGLFDEAY